ncbi:CynX/NimT family MFS transporter [Paenibacillus sp. GCM10012306]|uniref:MFS transporter n=1 Tax=Paenibacillus sp. GCM10012306 TaxID=3317342 RepID=UPI00360948DA
MSERKYIPRAPSRQDQANAANEPVVSTNNKTGSWLAVIALFMASLNLRPAVTSIAPVLESIRNDLGISGVAASLLVSIPVLCMGLLSPLSVRFGNRLGNERVITWSLILLGGSTLLRIVVHTEVLLFLTTLLAGIGIATMGPLLSGFIKKHLASRMPLMIALYSMALALGAALGSSLSAPFQMKFHSWQTALSFWAILALAAVPFWCGIMRRSNVRTEVTAVPGTSKLPWKNKKAWLLSIHLGLLAMIFYSLMGWLPLILINAGDSHLHARMMLTVFAVVQIPSGLMLQMFMRRFPSRRTWLLVSTSMQGIGLAFLFSSMLYWPGVLLCGFGSGMLFALGNLLPIEAASNPEEAASWAAMTQSVGYLIGATGPILIGFAYDSMGQFSLGILGMILVSLIMLVIQLFIVPRKEKEKQKEISHFHRNLTSIAIKL